MSPGLRNALIVLLTIPISVWLGAAVAQQDYLLPTLFGFACVCAILIWITGLGVDAMAMGTLVVGYVVGNRGFAQLSLSASVPLFPAEAGLLLAAVWISVRSALRRELPYRADRLNLAVFLWLLFGTIRVGFDLSEHGVLAIRDFAMVYYAAFFFVAQWLAREPHALQFLARSVMAATVLLLPVFALYSAFPEFFLLDLTVRGSPLIFFKGDLIYTFLVSGSVLLFHGIQANNRIWAWPLASVLLLTTAAGDNRASIAGALVAIALLLKHGHWRYPFISALLVVLGFLGVFAAAQMGNRWADRKIEGLRDRVISVVDFSGSAHYRSEESFYKGDNNRFRLVWWSAVARETRDDNPVFGLGFGYDLASNFVREYYPNSADDFSVRSPHNIMVTVFGRMGAVGLLLWGFLLFAIWRKTEVALRTKDDSMMWGLAASPWVILTASCFGVVLEGPMGAVPFWILLGLLNAKIANQTPAIEPRAAAPENPSDESSKA